LQQQFLFPCQGPCSTNHFPHQFAAQTLPVVWCNHKIHSFSNNQSRVVKGQDDWEKFFEQVGTNEIWSYIHLHLIETTTLHLVPWCYSRINDSFLFFVHLPPMPWFVSPPTISHTIQARDTCLWFGVTLKYIALVKIKAGL
jgi:hypothetical protein